jgi:NADH-quinone oxidoreductase subunit C
VTDEPRNDSDPTEDKDAAEENVAADIDAAIDEPSSIEEEMMEEAAMLEEVEAGMVEAGEGDAAAEEVDDRFIPDHAPAAALAQAFADVRFEPSTADNEAIAHVPPGTLVEFMTAARDQAYATFIDLCGVDYLRRRPRFEVVIHLVDPDTPHRLRARVPVDGTDPVVPSITSVFPGANFYERETYDLYGIDFGGHPDLTRILMPDDWEGHPLRKDYAVGSVPVQFKGSHKAT